MKHVQACLSAMEDRESCFKKKSCEASASLWMYENDLLTQF